MTEKSIRISCSSKIIKNRTENNDGLIWRSWKIMIRSARNDLVLSNCIDHVEYLLHPSFKNPRIVCIREPYMIQQEGWGEFDLRVILHFRDGSLPQTILFDVNFNRNKYSAFHKLNINESSLMKQSKKRSRQGSFSSVSSSPTITTPIDEYIMPNLALLQNENDLQEQPYDPKPKTSCRSPKETFTRDTKSNFGNVPENVNLSKLATRLESLDDDDLREIYLIILQYDTKNMAIVETKDEVLLDLCTLGPCLLTELERYTTSIKRKRKRLNQVKCNQASSFGHYSDVYVANNDTLQHY